MKKLEIVKQILIEITKGEGAYAKDPLEHAENCIENMKRLATEALTEINTILNTNLSRKVVSISGGGACPAQYTGKLDSGEEFYARYRWGCGTLEINDVEVSSISAPGNHLRGYFEDGELVELFSQAGIELEPDSL